MDCKAIFFDLDGTLTDSATHTIPPSAKEALHLAAKRGIKLFLATGRPPIWFRWSGVVEGLPFDGFLTSNGQYCYNDREVIRRKSIPQTDKEALIELLKDNPCPIMFFAEDEIYLNMVNEWVDKCIALLQIPMPSLKNPAVCLEHDIFALVLCGDDKAIKRHPLTVMLGCKATRWSIHTDIIPADGGKEIGIDAMLQYYGIPLEQTMAFGDAHNDIAMLRHVGLGVAMGNANPIVKAAAGHITGSARQDGIYNALTELKVI